MKHGKFKSGLNSLGCLLHVCTISGTTAVVVAGIYSSWVRLLLIILQFRLTVHKCAFRLNLFGPTLTTWSFIKKLQLLIQDCCWGNISQDKTIPLKQQIKNILTKYMLIILCIRNFHYFCRKKMLIWPNIGQCENECFFSACQIVDFLKNNLLLTQLFIKICTSWGDLRRGWKQSAKIRRFQQLGSQNGDFVADGFHKKASRGH